MDTWALVANGRTAWGDYLEGLAPGDWARPSLCAGWSVKDVAAHLLVVPTMSKGRVFRAFLGAGFDLTKMNARFVARLTADLSTAAIVEATRASAGSRSMPPGLKLPGVLTELVVHAADVSESIGVPFALPAEAYVAALDHLKGVQPVFGSKQRIAGLSLRATDAPWSTGSGPAVEGPAVPLLLAVAGRRAGLDALSGPGLATLRTRFDG